MAMDISLSLFDLRSRGQTIGAGKDIISLFQIGFCPPHRVDTLESNIPLEAGEAQLAQIVVECERMRDISTTPLPLSGAADITKDLGCLIARYGPPLFEWLFAHSEYLADIAIQGQGPKRLRICVPLGSERLRGFPFELLEPSRAMQQKFPWLLGSPLAVTKGWSLVRSLPMDFKDIKAREIGKLVVLVISEQPDKAQLDRLGLAPIDVEKELGLIENKLATVSNVEVMIERNPSLATLHEIVRDREVHCLHVIAHGRKELPKEQRPGELLFRGERGEAVFVDAGKFATTIQRDDGETPPRAVVINACESEGFSNDLIRAGVPAVVLTQFPVNDRACETFAAAFYDALARNGDIEQAVLEGRRTLYFANSVQWASYALYLQASHGRLFELEHLDLNLQWIHIPAGTYKVGADETRVREILSEFGQLNPHNLQVMLSPLQEKHVPEFWITKYPITNDVYGVFVRKHPGQTPPHWPAAPRRANHPVVGVSWDQAKAFAAWLGAELPSVEQWEKAARGNTDVRCYPWGSEFNATYCNCADNGAQDTVDVGQHPAGDSPHGVSDLVGNVLEWMREVRPDGYAACKGGAFDMTCEIFGLLHYTMWVENGFAEQNRGFRLASATDPHRLRRGNHIVVQQDRTDR
jgi:formylglycine-generating enzyme required for sulfatase activity